MRRTRWTAVLACFVTTTVISLILFDLVLRHRGWVPGLTAWGAVVAVVMTVLVLVAGLAVRRLRANKDTWIDAIGAMRVAVFARASAIVGSALAGVLIGVMIVSLTQLEASAMVANAIASGLSGLVGLVWIVVALVVERWCVINPDDDGSSSSHKRSAAA